MGRVSMPQGRGSQMHNRRDYAKYGREIPSNIDQSRTGENIVIVDRDVRQAYEDIFGAAVAEYNAGQQRADRQITDYYDRIAKSRNGEKLFYEDIVQWGDKDDFTDPVTRQKAISALVEYASTFSARNPNLALIGAYIHLDEASPHLHLDYVPVATGYKRGMSTRNSLDRALKQMGFAPEKGTEGRKNNATMSWKRRERSYFGALCRKQGLVVGAEQKARGSYAVEVYKELQDTVHETERLQASKKVLSADVAELRSLQTDIAAVDKVGTHLLGLTIVKDAALAPIQEQAKAYAANRDEMQTLRARSAAVSRQEQQLSERGQQLAEQATALAAREQQVQAMYQRQLDLNVLLEDAERAKHEKDKQIAALRKGNRELQALAEPQRDLQEQVKRLESRLGAMSSLLREGMLAFKQLTSDLPYPASSWRDAIICRVASVARWFNDGLASAISRDKGYSQEIIREHGELTGERPRYRSVHQPEEEQQPQRSERRDDELER